MFRVIVEQVEAPEADRKVYEQTVETLDLKRVIEAVNYKPRVRNRKSKDEEK